MSSPSSLAVKAKLALHGDAVLPQQQHSATEALQQLVLKLQRELKEAQEELEDAKETIEIQRASLEVEKRRSLHEAKKLERACKEIDALKAATAMT